MALIGEYNENSMDRWFANIVKEQQGWVNTNGKWYYYKNGVMQKGWLKDGSKWYYLNSISAMNLGYYEESEDSITKALEMEPENKEYKVGNIITFKNQKGEIITHRISEIVNTDLQKAFITKGDNNIVNDEEIVKYDNIIGKVIYTMPKFGVFMNLLKNKIFFGFCILVLIGIIYYDSKLKKRMLDRKLVREKYEKKSDFYF